MTYIKEDGLQDSVNPLNRNIQFGVREFAMGTILNGMAAHGGLRVYGGTFFVFSDYVKAAVRLSALQGLPVTYVFTHDSIAVGEDGPTHEPIETWQDFVLCQTSMFSVQQMRVKHRQLGTCH